MIRRASETSPRPEAVADRLETVITGVSPEKANVLVRLLMKELRVNGKSEIVPTYRVVAPEVCATPTKVGLTVHYTNHADVTLVAPSLTL